MFIEFSKYFFKYIFKGKNKQRLLLLAIVGLFISTFSLFVLQGTMGGLQNNQIKRQKGVAGDGIIYLLDKNYLFAKKVQAYLKKKNIHAVSEFEIELLLRNKSYISPIILHGVETDGYIPNFLENIPLENLVLPMDLSIKVGANLGDNLQMISPSHVDSFFGDIPRSTTANLDFVLITNVPEIDSYHAWTEIALIWDLTRKKEVNQIRVYNVKDIDKLKREVLALYKGKLNFNTWEEQNKTFVMALKLESTVMVFLFIVMTMLVSLCITSGLMIFLDKIKNDLASFWILGASKDKLEKVSFNFLNMLSLCTVILGFIFGYIFLILLDKYGIEIMPDVFVDRKIPIHITYYGALISIFIPYTISMSFTWFSLNQFKKDVNYLDHVRAVG